MDVVPGQKYRHFKGGIYEVVLIAKSSESNCLQVVYRELDDKEKVWVRPLVMFSGSVIASGLSVKRFTLIEGD